MVALREGEPPVIVELKLKFSLSLLQQGVARLSVSDHVYVCVPKPPGKSWKAFRENVKICRRLGLGVMTVRQKDGFVEVPCDPGPYAPRKNKRRKALLLREFRKRRGDPSKGGATRDGLVTAYRQDALRIAAYLAAEGPSKGAVVAKATEVTQATTIMRINHYGWFDKHDVGVYGLNDSGVAGLAAYRGSRKRRVV